MKTLSNAIFAVFFLLFVLGNGRSFAGDVAYPIINGTGKIVVNFTDSTLPEGFELNAMTFSIFDDLDDVNQYRFARKDNTFTCEFPMELKRNIIGFFAMSPTGAVKHSVGFVELTPGMTLEMQGMFRNDGFIDYIMSDTNGFNACPLDGSAENKALKISEILVKSASYHLGDAENEPDIMNVDFTSWKDYSSAMESLYEAYKNYVFERCVIPAQADWVDNIIRYTFDVSWRMKYKKRAEIFGKETADYPSEYFSFLNGVDFSPAFLQHAGSMTGPYYLLKSMNELLPFAEPIADAPVAEWQKTYADSLQKIIKEPTPLLLDLLAGASYVSQLNDENKIFTPRQIDNIKFGLNPELAQILLRRNDKLVAQLKNKAVLTDLSEKTFILKDYLDKEYPGKVVVVDLWNTWCQPCLMSHKETADIDRDLYDAVFLNISDTTSPENQWRTLSERIGGKQLRISNECYKTICQEYGLKGIPSYLVFDASHKLIMKQTGFPGREFYLKWIEPFIKQ